MRDPENGTFEEKLNGNSSAFISFDLWSVIMFLVKEIPSLAFLDAAKKVESN